MQSIGRSSSWGRGAGLEEWWCEEREKVCRGGGEWWISTDVVEIKKIARKSSKGGAL
jgi:hypothetical protein